MTTYATLTDLYIITQPDGGQKAYIAQDEVPIGTVSADDARARAAVRNWTPLVEATGYTVIGDVKLANKRGDMILRIGRK